MGSKTEQPTRKRLQAAARKGQIYRPRALLTLLSLLLPLGYLFTGASLEMFQEMLRQWLLRGMAGAEAEWTRQWLFAFCRFMAPLLLLACLPAMLLSALFSRFVIVTGLPGLDLNRLNPMAGLKRWFSWHSVKTLVCSLLYLLALLAALVLVWQQTKQRLAVIGSAGLDSLVLVATEIAGRLCGWSLVCVLPVVLLDAWLEYLLWLRPLRMDKQELRREYREAEGAPEQKSHQRQSHRELLSDQLKADIAQSTFIVANPTHLAIGFYVNGELSRLPMVSVRERNQMALAVLAWARHCQIPVVRDIRLTRRLYPVCRRYGLISPDWLADIERILAWLKQVELAEESQFQQGQRPACSPTGNTAK